MEDSAFSSIQRSSAAFIGASTSGRDGGDDRFSPWGSVARLKSPKWRVPAAVGVQTSFQSLVAQAALFGLDEALLVFGLERRTDSYSLRRSTCSSSIGGSLGRSTPGTVNWMKGNPVSP